MTDKKPSPQTPKDSKGGQAANDAQRANWQKHPKDSK